MKLVFDTSIIIDHLRKGPVWNQIIDLTEGRKDVEFFIPTIVVFELFSGLSTRSALVAHEIDEILKDFQRLECTEEIAKQAGELYRDVNKHLEVPDYIIAATALSIGASVVTLNKKHFEQIPQVSLYKF